MRSIITIVFTCLCFIASAQPPADSFITKIMDAGHLPGVTAVIVKEGHLVYHRSWGKANIPSDKSVSDQTVFMLASVSKTMIATSLMQLWERGAFKLDDNINNYLPFQVHFPNHPSDSITFRMLVTHTSAIKDNYNVITSIYGSGDSPVSLDTFLKNYLLPGGIYYSSSQNFYPYHSGAASNYSNIGATLAAYLVQRISGDDYGHYCDTAIFQKLCMDHTSFKLAGISDTTMIARPYSWNGLTYDDMGLYGYPDYPDGQLRTNITALARFMTMYMQYGIYNGTRVLDSSTVAIIMSPQIPVFNRWGIFFYKWLSSNNDTLWGHNGGDAGVSTAMYFNLQRQTGVIVLTNGDPQIANDREAILDTLYKYGLTITPSVNDTFPQCNYVTTENSLVQRNVKTRIFPNPVNDELFIDFEEVQRGPISITISTMTGSIVNVLSETWGKKILVNTSNLIPGLYLMTLKNQQQTEVLKFVKY